MVGAAARRQQQVVFLGIDGAGKTCVLRRLIGQEVGFMAPTFGFHLHRVKYGAAYFDLMDVGGGPGVRSSWPRYCAQAQGIVYVIDGSDRRRLEEAGAALQKILAASEAKGQPLLVLVNKQDVLESITPLLLVKALNLSGIRDRQWHVEGCSARTNQGVHAGVTWLLQQCSGPTLAQAQGPSEPAQPG